MKKGTVSELWRISYPMMVSFFSAMFMIFVDRLFLSRYSPDMLSAAVQAGTLSWCFTLGWITMASMSEVFVAQFNGAGRYKELGSPVWQMIWFCLASYLFFIPVALWGAAWIYDPVTRSGEYIFFQMLTFFAPFMSLVPAISGFFVGRGKVAIIQWVAVLGNVINIGLDALLIFGVEGLFPPLGIKGAGIATGIGITIQAVILLVVFLSKKNRENYNTNNFALNFPLLLKTLKIGLPPAVFVSFELLGWSLFYHFMAMTSPFHIFVASICQSILLLFLFFGMGLEKGTIAMTGNFIGAGEPQKAQEVFISGVKLTLIFLVVASFFLVIYPEPLITWFFAQEDKQVLLSSVELAQAKSSIRLGLIFMLFYLLFEKIRWLLNGILTAAGDTLFLLTTGALTVWLILLVPTYFFIVVNKLDVSYSFFIWVLYAFISCLLVYARFLYGSWKKKEILSIDQEAL